MRSCLVYVVIIITHITDTRTAIHTNPSSATQTMTSLVLVFAMPLYGRAGVSWWTTHRPCSAEAKSKLKETVYIEQICSKHCLADKDICC